MSIVIRDTVAKDPPYDGLFERLLRQGRRTLVLQCPRDLCPTTLFVFYERETDLLGLEDNVRSFLSRTHPDHDAICSFNEDLPQEPGGVSGRSGT